MGEYAKETENRKAAILRVEIDKESTEPSLRR